MNSEEQVRLVLQEIINGKFDHSIDLIELKLDECALALEKLELMSVYDKDSKSVLHQALDHFGKFVIHEAELQLKEFMASSSDIDERVKAKPAYTLDKNRDGLNAANKNPAEELKQEPLHYIPEALGFDKELDPLVSKCVRVTRPSSSVISACTFRMKNNKGVRVATWREVHKVELHSYLQKDETAIDSIVEDLTWRLLDNRKYFNTCRCCGKLNHIDEMNDRLCKTCIDEDISKDEWLETYFIKHYMKLQHSPTFYEYIESTSPDPVDLDYLVVPDFLKAEKPSKEIDLDLLEVELALDDDMDSSDDLDLVLDDKIYGILCCSFIWNRPHSADIKWKQAASFDTPLSVDNTDQIQVELHKVLSNRRYFHTCVLCGELKFKGHMSGRTCYSCMESKRGVCF